MATYIIDADITDKLLSSSNALSDRVTESDAVIEDIAESMGVVADCISVPVHYLVSQTAIAFVCWRIAEDYTGYNPAGSYQNEVYLQKREYYKEKFHECRDALTSQIFTGDVDSVEDRAGAGFLILRGD